MIEFRMWFGVVRFHTHTRTHAQTQTQTLWIQLCVVCSSEVRVFHILFDSCLSVSHTHSHTNTRARSHSFTLLYYLFLWSLNTWIFHWFYRFLSIVNTDISLSSNVHFVSPSLSQSILSTFFFLLLFVQIGNDPVHEYACAHEPYRHEEIQPTTQRLHWWWALLLGVVRAVSCCCCCCRCFTSIWKLNASILCYGMTTTTTSTTTAFIVVRRECDSNRRRIRRRQTNLYLSGSLARSRSLFLCLFLFELDKTDYILL